MVIVEMPDTPENRERLSRLMAARMVLLGEYKAEGRPEDMLNWLYKKAVEARAELAELRKASQGVPRHLRDTQEPGNAHGTQQGVIAWQGDPEKEDA